MSSYLWTIESKKCSQTDTTVQLPKNARKLHQPCVIHRLSEMHFTVVRTKNGKNQGWCNKLYRFQQPFLKSTNQLSFDPIVLLCILLFVQPFKCIECASEKRPTHRNNSKERERCTKYKQITYRRKQRDRERKRQTDKHIVRNTHTHRKSLWICSYWWKCHFLVGLQSFYSVQ